GLVFMSAPNDQWKLVAAHLIARAHTIALLIPADVQAGEGFRGELDKIVEVDRSSRVGVVLPPPQRHRPQGASALRAARAIAARLRWARPVGGALDDELDAARSFSEDAIVVRWMRDSRAPKWWVPGGAAVAVAPSPPHGPGERRLRGRDHRRDRRGRGRD